MGIFEVETTRHLPQHDRVLKTILDFFFQQEGVSGCYLSGSTAAGDMDEDSDLDLGVLFHSVKERDAAWLGRWEWDIAPWFHRFDADHIKPYFVIYFFEPDIKADINLYLRDDLPPLEGGPYEIVWDQMGTLGSWIDSLGEAQEVEPDWDQVVHEDERFWAWTFYCYSHVHRGEYYHVAFEFPVLRDILEQWAAKLAGYPGFNSQRLEREPFSGDLFSYDLFPKPDPGSLKSALKDAICYQLDLREAIEDRFKGQGTVLDWKTSREAVEKITALVDGL